LTKHQAVILFRGNMFSYGNEYGSYTAITCHPDLKVVESIDIVEGRFVNEIDIKQARKSVVLGKDIYDALFKGGNAIGEYVRVNNIPFKVVGICKEGGGTRHRNAYIPVTTGQRVFNGSNGYTILPLRLMQKALKKARQSKLRFVRQWHKSTNSTQKTNLRLALTTNWKMCFKP
jgi:putative ABC transport system permease protein